MATMRDVALRAGVSAKTVSRVFNDDPHVAPDTAARVQQALRDLNYVPNTLATTFRAGRSPVIGVAVPDISDPFFGSIAKGADTMAVQHNLSVVIASLGEEPSREKGIVASLLRQALSGLIIAPVSTDHAYLAPWADRTPMVFVDRPPVGLAADCILEDDQGGSRAATVHLIDHGHRRVGFLGESESVSTVRARLAGYRQALEERGVEVDDRLVMVDVTGRDAVVAALRTFEALGDPPSAVFSSSARITMSMVPRLAERGLAVASFGDFPLADSVLPALTVIDQNPFKLGRLAAQRVIDRLAEPAPRLTERTVLPVELVERESCFVDDRPQPRLRVPG